MSQPISATGDPFQRLATFLALAGLLVWNVAGWLHPLLHRHAHADACLSFAGHLANVEGEACSPAAPASTASCCCSGQRLAAEPMAAADQNSATAVATIPGVRASTECSHLTCALCKLTKSTHALLLFTADLEVTLRVAPAVILSDVQPGYRLLSTVARGPPPRPISGC